MNSETEVKQAVKQAYSAVARGERCCTTDLTQLGPDGPAYSAEEMASLPQGAALGLGCGNPTRILPLEPGMTVLDLGSGAGIDVFLAARKVGPSGRVIGVDMTESMIEKARANAAAGGFTNVEFRLGEIETLPAESGSIDVIISNCVINLAPDKDKVFAEAYRVLKPGGHIQISDIVTEGEVPESIRRDFEKWAGCVSGALDRDVYLEKLRAAGFASVEVLDQLVYDAYRTDSFAALSISLVATKYDAPEWGG